MVDRAKMAATELSETDEDFRFMGEYQGTVLDCNGAQSKLGLQVVSLGDGEFMAQQYRGGLPGLRVGTASIAPV